MRNSAFVIASAFLVSFAAVAQSGVINDSVEGVEPLDGVAPLSLIDPIIKAILEAMRPSLANLKFKDINKTIADPRLNATIIATDMQIQDLDKFNIQVLKSNLVPLKLTNLTLTWNEVNAGGAYNVNVSVANPRSNNPFAIMHKSTTPFKVFGSGTAKVSLSGVFFTIGANIEMKGKTIQVKPKGFFGFDVSINKANVNISSLMGSTELGKAVSVFISNALPELVNTLKKPVFEAFHDDIVRVVNDILKNGPPTLGDEPQELPFEDLDLSEELDEPFFRKPLDLGLEGTEFEAGF